MSNETYKIGKQNQPNGLEETDTVQDALDRADTLSNPDGSHFAYEMKVKKDLRRIVLLAKEVKSLKAYVGTLERR